MKKPKIYLDTSIISAYFDFRKPVRQLITEKWVQNDLPDFEVYISELVLNEINNNTDEKLKEKMLRLLNEIKPINLEINEEVLKIAQIYRNEILSKEINDTVHIAVVSFYGLEILVSWNFRHIVNWRTINTIHKINLRNNLDIIEILSIENLGGEKYGNV